VIPFFFYARYGFFGLRGGWQDPVQSQVHACALVMVSPVDGNSSGQTRAGGFAAE